MTDIVGDDELVFLSRSRSDLALDQLQKQMEWKQDCLIRKLLSENRYCGLEHDDLKIVAVLALYTAVDSYDPAKAVFDAFYHLILERELVNEMKRFNSGAQTILNTAISLDEEIDENSNLYDIFGSEDDKIKFGSESGILQLAEDPSMGLNPLEKSIIAYRCLGYSFSEIGRIMKKNYRQISRIVREIAFRKKMLDLKK
jgi:RNA polymerase sigma factor (sigma-70 family)